MTPWCVLVTVTERSPREFYSIKDGHILTAAPRLTADGPPLAGAIVAARRTCHTCARRRSTAASRPDRTGSDPNATTVPPGSFKKTGALFTFAGVIDGVNLQALIFPTGTLRYAFAAAAEHPNLTGTKNPVPVTLTIGNDTGMTSVNALIFH